MKVETVHDGIRYTLSNDKLRVGDKVFGIGWGRCLDDGGWILHNLDYREVMSGFPNDPCTIKNLNYDNGRQSKAYQVQTDRGFGPIESYYKIVKMEEQIKVKESMFGGTWEWVEISQNKA
jgi:hypothetical protein